MILYEITATKNFNIFNAIINKGMNVIVHDTGTIEIIFTNTKEQKITLPINYHAFNYTSNSVIDLIKKKNN